MLKLLVTAFLLLPLIGFASEQTATLQINNPYRFFLAHDELHLQNGRLTRMIDLDWAKPYCSVMKSRSVKNTLSGTLSMTSEVDDQGTIFHTLFSYQSGRSFLRLDCVSYTAEVTLDDVNQAIGDIADLTLN
jgi:hypothetical protein